MDFARVGDKLDVIGTIVLRPLTATCVSFVVFSFGGASLMHSGCMWLQQWGQVDSCSLDSQMREMFIMVAIVYALVRVVTIPINKWGRSLHSKIRDEHYLIGRKLVSSPSKDKKK